MPPPDTYFLTESVSLEYQRLIQRGIGIDKDRKEFQYEGPYTQEKHYQWVEQRRRQCQQRGWLAKDIIKVGGDMQILFGEKLSFPPDLMELIWKLTDSPTGTPFSEIKIDEKISGLLYPEIQIPFISWLHKNTLKSIISRREELLPNKNNLAIKSLWDFNNLARQVIEAWYIRNNRAIPKIEYPGIKLSEMDKCYELFKEAMEARPQTPDKLQEWKQRFDEFPSNYIPRCAKRYGSIKQGPGAGNGLEWRRGED